MDLRFAAAVGEISDPRTVRRPDRRGIAVWALRNGAPALAVGGSDPEIAVESVVHLVGPTRRIDDELAIGTDLGSRDGAPIPERVDSDRLAAGGAGGCHQQC